MPRLLRSEQRKADSLRKSEVIGIGFEAKALLYRKS
jgi:hypothetical protein